MKRSFAALAFATLGLAACVDDTPTEVATPAVKARADPANYVAPYMPGRVIVRFASARVTMRGPARAAHGSACSAHGVGASAPRPERGAAAAPRLRAERDAGHRGRRGRAAERGRGRGVRRAGLPDRPDSLRDGRLRGPLGLLPVPQVGPAQHRQHHAGRRHDAHRRCVDADMDWLEAYDALGATPGGTAKVAIVDTGIRGSHVELAGRVVAARTSPTGYPATLVDDRDGARHARGRHRGRPRRLGQRRGVRPRHPAHQRQGLRALPVRRRRRAHLVPRVVHGRRHRVGHGPGRQRHQPEPGRLAHGDRGLGLAAGGAAYARSKNVLPFCATGNDNYFQIAFPARFPECIAVGATNWGDQRASYSNYGPGTEHRRPGW